MRSLTWTTWSRPGPTPIAEIRVPDMPEGGEFFLEQGKILGLKAF